MQEGEGDNGRERERVRQEVPGDAISYRQPDGTALMKKGLLMSVERPHGPTSKTAAIDIQACA